MCPGFQGHHVGGRLVNTLLIYPEWPDTYWSFKHVLPFEGTKSVYPPLGLLTVSSLLPKHWKKRDRKSVV